MFDMPSPYFVHAGALKSVLAGNVKEHLRSAFVWRDTGNQMHWIKAEESGNLNVEDYEFLNALLDSLPEDQVAAQVLDWNDRHHHKVG